MDTRKKRAVDSDEKPAEVDAKEPKKATKPAKAAEPAPVDKSKPNLTRMRLAANVGEAKAAEMVKG